MRAMLETDPALAFRTFLRPKNRVKMKWMKQDFKMFFGFGFLDNSEFVKYVVNSTVDLTLERLASSFADGVDLSQHYCKTCSKPTEYSTQYNKMKDYCDNACSAKGEETRKKISSGVMNNPNCSSAYISSRIHERSTPKERSVRASLAANKGWDKKSDGERSAITSGLQLANTKKLNEDESHHHAKNAKISETSKATWSSKPVEEIKRANELRAETMESRYTPEQIDDIRSRQIKATKETKSNWSEERKCEISSNIKASLEANRLSNGYLPNQQHLEPQLDILNDKAWVEDQYITQYKSTDTISNEISVSASLVQKFLHKHEIPVRYDATISAMEMRVFNHVKSLIPNDEVIQSYRPEWMERKELDIFIPKFNVAIEVNGNYYHSTEFKPESFHVDKTNKCEANGVHLFHFFEHDLRDKFELCMSMVSNKFGNNQKVFARECAIKEVPYNDCKSFLNDNHLQGSVIGEKHRYGLYFYEELVCVMTFGKQRIKNPTHEMELYRFASLRGITVVGGASRLLKHFYRQNDCKSLLTYADRTHSSGGLYRALGFESIGTSNKLDYFWCNGTTVLSRGKTQKSNLQKLLGEAYVPSNPETQNMEAAGYRKVVRCGNLVFQILK